MKRPRPRPGVDGIGVGIKDPTISRAIVQLEEGQRRRDRVGERQVIKTDLRIGENEIAHSLGRVARGCTLTPTIADAAFAWAWTDPGSSQDRIFVNVIGAAQPGAKLEVY